MSQIGHGGRNVLALGALFFAGALVAACTGSGGGGGRARVDAGGSPPGTDGGVSMGRRDGAPPPTGVVCEDNCGPGNSWVGDGACDDGADGSMFGVCAFGNDCTDCGPRNASDCTPDCADRTCGPDGCFGFCGDCTAPETCQDGTCGVCTPDCTDRTCGDDGCGGSCGDCAAGEMCYRDQCSAPSCAGRTCGSDGAGGTCGDACGMGQTCREGNCVACDCTGRSCASDGCGMSCGDCPMGQLCDHLAGSCSAMPDASCNNTCGTAGDNECDDGGPGSLYSLCELGSDCSDCGRR